MAGGSPGEILEQEDRGQESQAGLGLWGAVVSCTASSCWPPLKGAAEQTAEGGFGTSSPVEVVHSPGGQVAVPRQLQGSSGLL